MTQSKTEWPIGVLGDDLERVEKADVRAMNVAAGRAIAETVRTTLGPMGMDKMLVGDGGKVVVTNDGATILERVDIDHPAARAIVEVARTQSGSVGDGTTTAVVLAGELLAEAATLFERGLHPTTIEAGYRRALDAVRASLDSRTMSVDPSNTEVLTDVALTAITGKWTDEEARTLADLVVTAAQSVERSGRVERSRITRTTIPGGSPTDSALVEGLVIDMDASSTTLASLDVGLPRHIEDADIVLVDDQLTIETADAITRVSVTDPAELERIEGYERTVHETQADSIADVGADVVFCQKSIDDETLARLAERDVVAVERTRQDEMHKLARVTGAELVRDVADLTAAHVGRAGVVERRTVAATPLVVVRDCPTASQRSVLVRGGTEHVIEETKRLLENCLDDVTLAIEEGAVVPGGGAAEVAAAAALRDLADGIAGREQLAVVAFADALETIPRTLARTAGLDPVDTLVTLRNRHEDGDWRAGIDVTEGTVTDVAARGVLEPATVKRAAIASAAEAASVLVGIDDVILASDVEAGAHGHEGGHDHEHDHGGLAASEGYPWAVGH